MSLRSSTTSHTRSNDDNKKSDTGLNDSTSFSLSFLSSFFGGGFQGGEGGRGEDRESVRELIDIVKKQAWKNRRHSLRRIRGISLLLGEFFVLWIGG